MPPRLWTGLALAAILLSSFLLKLINLDHLALKDLDESFHAIVAQNLLKHPLVPTLMERPYLSISQQAPKDAATSEAMWQNSHVWLHKPIVPLWQIALSYAALGVNTFALRLPSVILSTLAAWLTYLIGRELLNRTAGVVAAALQAFNPTILMLVHGYVFSDHIDIALLFWVEVAVYFLVRSLRTGRRSDIVLAGVAQGLAFLSKTYPAFIVTGIALAAWLVPVLRLGSPTQARFRGRHVLLLLACTVLTIAPWTIYTAVRWPVEFRAEHGLILSHLGRDVEGWKAPWDRLLFEYGASIHYVFYTAVLSATIISAIQAWSRRATGLWVLLAWAIGVLVPNLLAASKPPAATVLAAPAFLLLLGGMISRAIKGDLWCLGGWVAAVAANTFFYGIFAKPGFGAPGEPLVALRQNLWILGHVAAVLGFAMAFGLFARSLGWVPSASQVQERVARSRLAAVFRWTLTAFAAAGTVYLGGRLVQTAWRVPDQYRHMAASRTAPLFQQVGEFASARLPEEAVILIEERARLERNQLMFAAGRTCYGSSGENWRTYGQQIVDHGGVPYLLTDRKLPFPAVFISSSGDRTLYALNRAGLELRPAPPMTPPSGSD